MTDAIWVWNAVADLPAPWVALAVATVIVDRSGGAAMADLRVDAAGSRPRRGGARVPALGTRGGLLKQLGRAVLWLLVLVLLLRGFASVLEPRPSATAASSPRPAAVTWPDDEARAFASDFARAYLTYNPKDPDASASTIRSFVSADLASSIAPEYGEGAPRRAVGSVAVAQAVRIDDSHALVT